MLVWMEAFSLYLQWEKIEEILGEIVAAVLICVILLSLLQCFAGYKIRKIWTAIEGVIVFGAVAAGIASKNGMKMEIIPAVAAGAGLVGGLLGYFLWIVGGFFRVLIFVFSAVSAVFISKDLMVLGFIIGLALGLIGGILQFAFNRPFMIGYTAVAGGSIAAFCLSKLIPQVADLWFLPIIIGSVLAVLGIVVQVLLEKMGAKKPEAAAKGMPPWAEEGAFGIAKASEPSQQPGPGGQSESGPQPGLSAGEESRDVLDDATKVYVPGRSAAEAESAASAENVVSNDAAGEKEPAGAEGAASEQDTVLPQKNLCPRCGVEYKLGAKFCMKCGQKL